MRFANRHQGQSRDCGRFSKRPYRNRYDASRAGRAGAGVVLKSVKPIFSQFLARFSQSIRKQRSAFFLNSNETVRLRPDFLEGLFWVAANENMHSGLAGAGISEYRSFLDIIVEFLIFLL